MAFDQDLDVRKAIDRVLRRHGVRANPVMEFDNIESIKRAISNKSGLSILPLPSIEKEAVMGTLRAIPLEGISLFRPVALIHRRKKALSRTVIQFIRMLREE